MRLPRGASRNDAHLKNALRSHRFAFYIVGQDICWKCRRPKAEHPQTTVAPKEHANERNPSRE